MSKQSVAVVLINPKTPFNVGAVIRACAIFGATTLRWTGGRIAAAEARRKAGSVANKDRLPREERMKDYTGVDWQESTSTRIVSEMAARGYTPVCVEIVDGSEWLDDFVHPAKAVYVFGQEDGDVPKVIRMACHRFVTIRTANRTPLNLAAAVNLVLHDRFIKEQKVQDPGNA